jgi:glycosyltransferase involved in cell wall biosynthesis
MDGVLRQATFCIQRGNIRQAKFLRRSATSFPLLVRISLSLPKRTDMPAVLPLSVIILTYNEEANILDCLHSVVDWAAEVFVVDSGSRDRTVALARRYTDNIVEHPFENYAQQRNWAQASLPLAYDWVLHLDADERISPELAQSLQVFFAGKDAEQVDGLLVTRRTVFMGRAIMHGGHYPTYHLRVFRRSKGFCEDRLYDQHFLVDGLTRQISGDLIDTITTDLSIWLARHARWAELEAQEYLATTSESASRRVNPRLDGNPIERRRWLRMSYGRAPLFVRAFGYFFYRYFLRLGFLDGTEGLIFHFLQGCWYRFYIDAKIYEMQKKGGSSKSEVAHSNASFLRQK